MDKVEIKVSKGHKFTTIEEPFTSVDYLMKWVVL